MSRGLQRRRVLDSSGSTSDGYRPTGSAGIRTSSAGSFNSSPPWHKFSAQELRSMVSDDFGPPVASRTNTISDSAKPAREPAAKPLQQVKAQTEIQASATPPSQGFVPVFSAEQQGILDLVVRGGESVFFTGAAGTGKSVLLRQIIVELKKRHKESIAVTASTGMAACNINGCTLHRFAGIGLGNEEASVLIKRIKTRRQVKARWKRTQVLIIDEISMITGELFDKLDEIARVIRQCDRPFGGIQVVVTGDFFQLPPVIKGTSRDTIRNYAFLAKQWPNVIRRTIHLTEVFRQRDPKFIDILNEMRKGHVSIGSEQFFQTLSRRPEVPDGIQPTRLFSRREEVERANRTALAKINSEEHVYTAEDVFNEDDPLAESELKNLMAPPEISLKIGAQVMMIKNIDEDLVNGSLGTVVGFERESMAGADPPGYHDDFEQERLEMEIQDLLNHPSEEYNPARFGLKEAAEKEFHKVGDAVDRRKRLRMARLDELEKKSSRFLPVVRFFRPDGTFREMTVRPETWLIHDPDNNVKASRSQIPLILAWAISIHKSQGQTLDWLTVDLSSVFEPGQAYVAVSRARSLNSLQVFNFRRRCVFSDETVRKFYDSLESLKLAAPRTVAEFFKPQQPLVETEVKQERQEKRDTTPLPAYLDDLPPPPELFEDLPPPPELSEDLPPPPEELRELAPPPPNWDKSLRPNMPDDFDSVYDETINDQLYTDDHDFVKSELPEYPPIRIYEGYNFDNPTRRFKT